ncbi:ZP4 protein, partial [Polypterus senegalus]
MAKKKGKQSDNTSGSAVGAMADAREELRRGLTSPEKPPGSNNPSKVRAGNNIKNPFIVSHLVPCMYLGDDHLEAPRGKGDCPEDDGLLLSKPEHLEIDFRMMAADEGRGSKPGASWEGGAPRPAVCTFKPEGTDLVFPKGKGEASEASLNTQEGKEGREVADRDIEKILKADRNSPKKATRPSENSKSQKPPRSGQSTCLKRACSLAPVGRCAVVDSEKLPCGGSSSITQADCEASNCCYDSGSSTSPCYYANDVTVQCTLDGQFVVVVSENVTLPSLDLGSIQLVDSSSPSCSPVTSLSSFVMYQFPVSACGSTVQLSGGNVTYQNTMSAAITVRSGPEGSITRDSVYKLFFQCTYSGSQDVQVEAEVYTVAPPLPIEEQGPFDLELVIATDSSYGSYYMDADYPVTKTLRDPVAVEVHIVNRTDPNLVLTLGDCWVTPGPSASSQPQWSLLVNGCPYAGDNYLTSLVTVDSTSGVDYPSHYKRFVFEMFAFVDPVAQQALAEKVGFFVAKGNPALFLWSCLKYCDGLKFGDRCMDTNQ